MMEHVSVYNNKFVIIEQEKIVLQQDSLEAGLEFLKLLSIPPRATKKYKNHHRVVFDLG